MKTCDWCGRENHDDATHCSGCGATKFRASTPQDAGTIHEVPPIARTPKQKTRYWRRFGAYLVGMAIVLVGTAWSVAVDYSTIPDIRILVAFFLGPFVAFFPIIINTLLQMGIRHVLRKRVVLSPLKETLAMNVPAVLFSLFLLVYTYSHTKPQYLFEAVFKRPVPTSVRNLEHSGGKINMSEPDHHALRFEIASNDLKEMIEAGKFARAGVEDEKLVYSWEGFIWNTTRMKFDLAKPYEMYVRRTEKGIAHIDEFLFCSSNGTSVFYLMTGY
jgi:hypothetical protein